MAPRQPSMSFSTPPSSPSSPLSLSKRRSNAPPPSPLSLSEVLQVMSLRVAKKEVKAPSKVMEVLKVVKPL